MKRDREDSSVKVKSCILGLEKAISKNTNLRMKYTDPHKFMESEIALEEAIISFANICSDFDEEEEEEQLSVVSSSNVLQSLVECLAHSNTDLVGTVLSVMSDLIDDDTFTLLLLRNSLVRSVCFALKVLVAGGQPDAANVERALGLLLKLAEFASRVQGGEIEAAIEVDFDEQALHRDFIEEATAPLLQVVSMQYSDQCKVLASEALATILLTASAYVKTLTSVASVESLLAQFHQASREKPTLEAIELASNLGDCVCSLLLYGSVGVREQLLSLEVVELAQSVVRRKGGCGGLIGTKMLYYACRESPAACERAVECGSLAVLGRELLSSRKKSCKRLQCTEEEYEDHLEFVVCALLEITVRSKPGTLPSLRVCKSWTADSCKRLRALASVWTRAEIAVNSRGLAMTLEEPSDEEEAVILRAGRTAAGLLKCSAAAVVFCMVASQEADVEALKEMQDILAQEGKSQLDCWLLVQDWDAGQTDAGVQEALRPLLDTGMKTLFGQEEDATQ